MCSQLQAQEEITGGGSTHDVSQEEAYYKENGPFWISNEVKRQEGASLQKVDAQDVATQRSVGFFDPALHIILFLLYLSAGRCAPETCAGSGGPTRRCI